MRAAADLRGAAAEALRADVAAADGDADLAGRPPLAVALARAQLAAGDPPRRGRARPP